MPEGVPEGWRAWVPRVELVHVLANYGDDLVGKLSGDVAGGVVIASETRAVTVEKLSRTQRGTRLGLARPLRVPAR